MRTLLLLAVAIPLSLFARGGGHSSTHSYSIHAPRGSSSRTYHSPKLSTSHHSSRCSSCARDHNGKIKRSPAARSSFRREHPCPATGRTSGACPGYVIDHVQALKHGGADSPENMQWQTKAAARAKDRWE